MLLFLEIHRFNLEAVMKKSRSGFTIFVSHPSEFLTDCQPHGDGLTAFGFISRLAERGHTLHVAVPEMEINGGLPDNIKFYPIKTRTKSLIPHRLEYMLRSRLLFNRLRRQHRFDLIHQFNPVNRGLSLAMIGTGLPVVLGQVYPDWPADAEAAVERMTLGQLAIKAKCWLRRQILRVQQYFASALIIATPASLDSLYHPERIREKIFLVNSGVDTEHFSPGPRLQMPQAAENGSVQPSILFLANLWRRKGILTLLEAFGTIAAKVPNCRLTVVGSSGIEDEVHARANAMSCRSQITFIKHVARDQMPALVRQCTVYCHPSYGEPLGNSALEVMACGKPIVGTDAGGLGLIIHPQGGRKVPPRDAAALANALIEILDSPLLQEQMGKFNRRLLEENYSWGRVVGNLESVYRTVLSRRSGAIDELSAKPFLIADRAS